MTTGLSLHVGVNHPDPLSYPPGWEDLESCEKTALAMRALADNCGFWTKCFLTEEATANRVLAQIEFAASILKSGDIFFLSYAGHGSQIPDTSGDEEDGFDETWVAYDRMISDDELFWLWSRFQPGVRILLVSDSCHSGTISSLLTESLEIDSGAERRGVPAQLPEQVALKVYLDHKAFYDAAQQRATGVTLDCTVLSLSACQDGEITTFDPDQGGLFTNSLLSVWENGIFQGNYKDFFRAIWNVYQAPERNPNCRVIGNPSYVFEDQRPFTV